ncbi:MAG TPA: efflux RND transporter periplasmic adaptor subunit [Afipia sp.]
MRSAGLLINLAVAGVLACGLIDRAEAQAPGGPPPAVGVVEAIKRPIIQTNEFLGRVEAVSRVAIVARVTAFLDKRLFTEGAEVKQNDPLYMLERGPFEADLASKKAIVLQLQATLENAKLTTERQRILLSGPAGQQSNYDTALANQRSLEAQVLSAQAQVQASQISLDYTDIRSPIDGKIGRTAVTEGNVVNPNSGTLTTIVSQDPMYVTFPVSVREAIELRSRYAQKGGFSAVVIRLRLPDGRQFEQKGELNFVNNTIAQNTDTITLRGVIPNPTLYVSPAVSSTLRELTDGEFVTVLLEGVQPVEVLAIPRSAVLTDQQGDYVFVVNADNKAEQRRIQLGQSTTTLASVVTGLALGDKVIAEGVQRVRPGQPVTPGPASALIQQSLKAAATEGPVRPDTVSPPNDKPVGGNPAGGNP